MEPSIPSQSTQTSPENQTLNAQKGSPLPTQPSQTHQTQSQNYLPGVKQLFGQAWQIYKDRWKTLVFISIIPLIFLIITLPFIIFSPFLTLALGKSFALISIIVIGVSACLILLLYMWSPVAQLYAIKDRNEKIGFKTSYGRSRNRVFLYIVLAILLMIINVFGFILFVIPGIIFAVWFSLAPYVFVAENTGPIEALKRSKQYVNGKFFEVLFRSMGIGLIGGLIAIILALIPIVNLFSGFLIPLIVVVIMTIYWFILYENLKALSGKTISNPISKTFVILVTTLLVIGVICAVIFTGYFVSNLIKNMGKTPKTSTYYPSNQNYNFPVQATTPTSIPNSTPTIEKCTLGLIPKDSYLDTYIVKPGDTILSIARTELGDVSRVNELIALNVDRYPSISVQTPLIEQGWSLYLPPKTINKSSGIIAAVNGEVIRKEDKYWWLRTRAINSQQGDFPLVLDNATKFIGIKLLQIGDCVKVIYDTENPQGITALVISGQ